MAVDGIKTSLNLERDDEHYVLVDIDGTRADFAGLTLTPREAGDLGGQLIGLALKAGLVHAVREVEKKAAEEG